MARTGASLVVVGALASPAAAHFKLVSPANVAVQASDGDPQKSEPCGLEDGPYTPSSIVTELMTGSQVEIKIQETIYHPGHYRVLLAETMDDLPPDPAVTEGESECGSTEIDDTPEMPLLADGLLQHSSAFSGQQTMNVRLPAGMQCESCVLQVVEFMSSHDAPCYYHHCAMVKITDNPADPEEPDPGPAEDTGCSAGSPSLLVALGLLALLRANRRC
jgi:hypothetical protein